MSNNSGEGVGKTESWCKPQFDKVGGESCIWAKDPEVGHDGEPEPTAHCSPLYGSDDRRFTPEQADGLYIKRISTLFIPRNGAVLSLAGRKIGASSEVFSFRAQYDGPRVDVGININKGVSKIPDQVLVKEVIRPALDFANRDVVIEKSDGYVSILRFHQTCSFCWSGVG